MFLHLSLCPREGGGGCLPLGPGGCASGSNEGVPLGLDTPWTHTPPLNRHTLDTHPCGHPDGQQASGTHPTGMLSCSLLWVLVLYMLLTLYNLTSVSWFTLFMRTKDKLQISRLWEVNKHLYSSEGCM